MSFASGTLWSLVELQTMRKIARMPRWTKTVPGTDIEVGGRDVPVGTPHYDPKKALAHHGIDLTAKGDLTEGQLKETGGLLNPEQAGADEWARRKNRPKWVVKAYSEGVAEEEYATVSSDGKENPTILNGKPIGAMTDELAVRKVAPIQTGKGPWKPDGEKASGGGEGEDGNKGSAGATVKSAGAQVAQSTPAVEGLTTPGFGYARYPKQKPLTEDQAKRPPKVVLGGAAPNATYPRAPIEQGAPVNGNPNLAKDEVQKDTMTDSAPTTDWDGQNGRPRWMVSPGYGGKEPIYVSQKPDGNKDTLFSQNINKDPPDYNAVDPDAYYIW